MKIRVSVEVFSDNGVVTAESNQEKAIAEGSIVGELELPSKEDKSKPVLSIRMRNILATVQETITNDSKG